MKKISQAILYFLVFFCCDFSFSFAQLWGLFEPLGCLTGCAQLSYPSKYIAIVFSLIINFYDNLRSFFFTYDFAVSWMAGDSIYLATDLTALYIMLQVYFSKY